MDKDGERKQLEDAAAIIAGYQNHAITQELDRADKESEDELLRTICNVPVVDLESFFVHFLAVGGLQQLRKRNAMLPAKLEEIQDKIKEL